jgi:nitrogen fixation/metabolism regulation signal transduction histidine kinase
LFVVSVGIGIAVVRGIFGPLDLIRTGIQFLRDSDFSTRFREVGQPELDEVTRVYNQMIDHLREERIRVQEQHHFLSQIVQASPSGVVIFDFDDRISVVNPAAERMLEAPAAELAGRTLAELPTPFAQALGELPAGEPRILSLAGNRRVKCARSRFVDRGFPRGFLMLEELTEELRRSERAAYEKIIRMMSHEVNNSVGASNSLLESCLNYKDQLRASDRPDFETALGVAISRSNHLSAFVKSYADVIRLPKPDKRPCDAGRLLEDVAVLVSAECRRRNIAWNWAIEEPLAEVTLDRHQMEQALVNIVRNAIEAIGEHGAITVRTGRRNGRGWLAVEDTGRGIPPEVRDKLFTPFFSTKENGRGIGLTLVQEILTQHGFRFSLESRPREGASFRIEF